MGDVASRCGNGSSALRRAGMKDAMRHLLNVRNQSETWASQTRCVMEFLPPITLRPIRPDDVEGLRAFLRGLSQETRYQRFRQLVTDFTPAQWRYLTRVDGHDHVALVACHGRRIVGVCRYIRDSERHDVAEVAFVVSDALQRRGLGRRLRDELVLEARANGIRAFEAFVTPQNLRIRRLLAGGGLALESVGIDLVRASLVACDSAAE